MKFHGASQETHLPDYNKRRANSADKPTGVNKIKNALRQTKRLLAKDTLAPGARIEAERRLKALERELEEKQIAEKERSRANRYHKVKFFERQKIHRKIRKLKRSLEQDPNDKVLRSELAESRVFLHYVMDQRYVALFADKTSEPKAPDADAPDRAHQKAAEFLKSVRKAVKKGTLSKEPEVHLEEREQASRQKLINKGTKQQAQDDAARNITAGHNKQPKHSAKSVSHKAQQETIGSVSNGGEEDASDTEQETSDPHTSSEASSGSSDSEHGSESESSDESSGGSSDRDTSNARLLAKASQRQVDRRGKAASKTKHAGSAASHARASTQKHGIAGDDFFAA